MYRRRKAAGIATCLATAMLALTACGNGGKSDTATGASTNGNGSSLAGKVYFILPDQTTIRFEKYDKPQFVAALKKQAPGMQVVVLNSGNQAQLQVTQVQTAITAGAKAIVMVPVDPAQAAGNLSLAKAAGIPVICMAHVCNGGPAYAYLTVPFVTIGQAQGQVAAKAFNTQYAKTGKPVRLAEMFGDPAFPFYTDQVKGFNQYLNPLITAGKLKVVCKADALQYLPSNAQTNMDQCLTKTHNGVDAILAMNDDTGGGALAAATAAAVKLPLYGGYDATLAGVQRVAAGIQPLDMTTDYQRFDSTAATLAIAAIQGKPVPANLGGKSYDNGYKGGITEIQAPNLKITAATLHTTVRGTGLYTKTQICTNSIASTSQFCRK